MCFTEHKCLMFTFSKSVSLNGMFTPFMMKRQLLIFFIFIIIIHPSQLLATYGQFCKKDGDEQTIFSFSFVISTSFISNFITDVLNLRLFLSSRSRWWSAMMVVIYVCRLASPRLIPSKYKLLYNLIFHNKKLDMVVRLVATIDLLKDIL